MVFQWLWWGWKIFSGLKLPECAKVTVSVRLPVNFSTPQWSSFPINPHNHQSGVADPWLSLRSFLLKTLIRAARQVGGRLFCDTVCPIPLLYRQVNTIRFTSPPHLLLWYPRLNDPAIDAMSKYLWRLSVLADHNTGLKVPIWIFGRQRIEHSCPPREPWIYGRITITLVVPHPAEDWQVREGMLRSWTGLWGAFNWTQRRLTLAEADALGAWEKRQQLICCYDMG